MQSVQIEAAGRLEGLSCFSLSRTLNCGQCFRWEEVETGVFRGVVRAHVLSVRQEGESLVLLHSNPACSTAFLRDYFDLDRDYRAIDRLLCLDERLERAAEQARGIHILRQEPWEALCSFILSQNNHIARIKGIVARLCALLGEPLEEGAFSFPQPQTLSGLTVEDLAPIRAGFRAQYLLDAAQKVASGQIVLEQLSSMDLDLARKTLCTIRGVGPKVAECVLLYGCGRMECFPVDVWIGRIMKKYFPDGLPESFRDVAGMAQQYLFHYGRMNKIK